MPQENVIPIDPNNMNLQKIRGVGGIPPSNQRLKNTFIVRKGLRVSKSPCAGKGKYFFEFFFVLKCHYSIEEGC